MSPWLVTHTRSLSPPPALGTRSELLPLPTTAATLPPTSQGRGHRALSSFVRSLRGAYSPMVALRLLRLTPGRDLWPPSREASAASRRPRRQSSKPRRRSSTPLLLSTRPRYRARFLGVSSAVSLPDMFSRKKNLLLWTSSGWRSPRLTPLVMPSRLSSSPLAQAQARLLESPPPEGMPTEGSLERRLQQLSALPLLRLSLLLPPLLRLSKRLLARSLTRPLGTS